MKKTTNNKTVIHVEYPNKLRELRGRTQWARLISEEAAEKRAHVEGEKSKPGKESD